MWMCLCLEQLPRQRRRQRRGTTPRPTLPRSSSTPWRRWIPTRAAAGSEGCARHGRRATTRRRDHDDRDRGTQVMMADTRSADPSRSRHPRRTPTWPPPLRLRSRRRPRRGSRAPPPPPPPRAPRCLLKASYICLPSEGRLFRALRRSARDSEVFLRQIAFRFCSRSTRRIDALDQ